MPVALIASVMRMARSGPLQRHQIFTISAVLWMPSQTSSANRESVVSTMPRMPGSRWSRGRMALNVCVALTAPAAMAARVSAAVAFEWPTEMRTPRRVAWAVNSTAPGNSGASVISRTWPSAASKSRSKTAMSGASRYSGGWTPRLTWERNGPSR